jgi:hypothetical protein
MSLRDRANKGKKVSVSQIRKQINHQHANMGKNQPVHKGDNGSAPDYLPPCPPGQFYCRVMITNPNLVNQEGDQRYRWECCDKRSSRRNQFYKRGGRVRTRGRK